MTSISKSKPLIALLFLALAILPADAANPFLPNTILSNQLNDMKIGARAAAFTDALPIPPRLVIPPGEKDTMIRLTPVSNHIYPGAPNPTQMWGYNGTSPGPTIEVEKDQPVRIHWKN